MLVLQSIERWDATPATKRILYKVQLGFLFVFLVRVAACSLHMHVLCAFVRDVHFVSTQAELALKTFCLGVGRFWRQSVFNKVCGAAPLAEESSAY